LKDQTQLLAQVKTMFGKSTMIVVENKTDMKKTNSSNLKISCETGDGIDHLVEELFSYYPSSQE
jgi:GTP1/Obg family GTP-binding protein